MNWLSTATVGALAMGVTFTQAAPINDTLNNGDDLETANNKRLFYTGILFVSGAAIGFCSSVIGCLTQSLITHRTLRAERAATEPKPSELRGWKSFKIEAVADPSPVLTPREANF